MIPARTNTTIHASGRNLKARRSPAPARACRDRAAAKAAAARRLRPRAPAERAGLRARLPWKGGPPRRGARNQEGLTKHHLCRRRRAARPEAVSSVAPNASAFRMTRASLRPCLGTTSASRRRVTFRQTLLGVGRLFVFRGRAPVAAHLEVGALDLTRLVGLEDVAFLHVVEVVEQDSALEAFLDLAHVVLEPLEAADRRLVDGGALPDDADLGITPDDPASHVAAGDDAQAGGSEERSHLGLAERLFDLLGGEHADEGLLDVLGQLVDDPIRAEVNSFALCQSASLGVRAHVEAGDDRVRSGGEHDVALRDRADARVDDVDRHLRVLDLR